MKLPSASGLPASNVVPAADIACTEPFALDLSFDLLVSRALVPSYGPAGEFVGFKHMDGSILRPILTFEKQEGSGSEDCSDLSADHLPKEGIEVTNMRDFALVSSADSPAVAEVLSAAVDIGRLATFSGVFVNGYTDADVNRVCGAILAATGIHVCVLWEYLDSAGYGGGSDFAIRFVGKLYEFTDVGEGEADLFSFLNGEGPCPTELKFELGKELASKIDSDFNFASRYRG